MPVPRDRHGRGLRGPLLPAELPAARSRSEQFDEAVLQAAQELEQRWPRELAELEFAVDDIPPAAAFDAVASPDVVMDGAMPLASFTPPGIDARGRMTKARIVVFRRPLEARAEDADDLADLVVEVLGEQIAAVLGEPPPED